MNYIDDFIRYLKVVRKHSDYTLTSYKNDLEELCSFKSDIIHFSDKDRDDYLEYLYHKGLNRNSISRKLSSIRSFYHYLEDEGIIFNNCFKSIKNPKRVQSLPKYAKDNDLEKMFSCFDKTIPLGQRNALLLEMLYATGVRVSELVNIKYSDIDYNNRRIRVCGKGNKERIVYFGEYALDALNEYTSTHKKNEQGYVFTNSKGGALTDRGVRYIIEKLMNKLSVKVHVTPHVLRHTFATDMLNNGCDIKIVQELLGHSSLRTTEIYTHVTNERLKEVYYSYFPRSDKNE